MSKAMAWSWVRVSCLVLLFSGCLAAAVNKDIPEAAEETPSLVTLTKFAFKEKKDTGERLSGKYTSLDVCFTKVGDIVGDEISTLLYTNADGSQMTEYNGAAPAEEAGGAVCVAFASADGTTAIDMPPPDKAITYNLHIASQTDGTEQMGEATFTLDPATYIADDVIKCGDASYTRETKTENKCTRAGGQYITGDICYIASGGATTDPEGCMTANPGGDRDDQLEVCLSDKGSTPAEIDGTASITSLSYTGGDITTGASLAIEYTDGDAALTKLEMIMQDPKNLASFYASACTDDISPCAIEGYSQGAKTYQVCAVNVVDSSTVTSTEADEITDLNLAATQYGDKLEFGFNNARPADGMYYSATVDDGTGSRTAVPVGINCNGVLADYTCYGFLDIALLTDGDLLLTVEYGVADDVTGDVSPAGLNTIIGTYTKTAL